MPDELSSQGVKEMAKRSLSDDVRDYVRRTYIETARSRGEHLVSVVAGDVHRALGLHNRVPLVCAALRSQKLFAANNVELENAAGPASGQSTTMTYTYRLHHNSGDETSGSEGLHEHFLKFLGAGKELFASLGGGEEFIRKERAEFNRSLSERESHR